MSEENEVLPTAKLARFAFRMVPRSQINPATYNPRVIDPYSLERLADGLDTHGLVEPLVWNERTGHLVGGHQRLTVLDESEQGDYDYLVPVAVVDVDENRERELNVSLNNTGLQGRYDLGRLESVFRETDASPFAAGFDALDLQLLFPADVAAEFLRKHGMDEEAETASAGLAGDGSAAAVELSAEVMAIKEARKQHMSTEGEDLRFDHMVVLVFDTAEETRTFLDALKLSLADQFIAAGRFCAAIQRPDLLRPSAATAVPAEETPAVDGTVTDT